MKDTIWLICNSNGVTKMLKSEPKCAKGEIAITVNVRVPDEAFKEWKPTATLQLSAEALQVHTAEVTVGKEE